jgi:hypothetical protein
MKQVTRRLNASAVFVAEALTRGDDHGVETFALEAVLSCKAVCGVDASHAHQHHGGSSVHSLRTARASATIEVRQELAVARIDWCPHRRVVTLEPVHEAQVGASHARALAFAQHAHVDDKHHVEVHGAPIVQRLANVGATENSSMSRLQGMSTKEFADRSSSQSTGSWTQPLSSSHQSLVHRL